MSRLEEPRCQGCGKTKTVVRYIDSLGQRVKLEREAPFKEPYPEGNAVTLLACAGCDDTASWPRTKPKKNRKSAK